MKNTKKIWTPGTAVYNHGKKIIVRKTVWKKKQIDIELPEWRETKEGLD